MDTVSIEGVELRLASPTDLIADFEKSIYGEAVEELREALEARERRLLTTIVAPTLREAIGIAVAAADQAALPCRIQMEAPAAPLGESLVRATPTIDALGSAPRRHFVASPLASAMIQGGVCVLGFSPDDKASWRRLLPIISGARRVDLSGANLTISAKEDFLLCLAVSEDEVSALPKALAGALAPPIRARAPDLKATESFLSERLPQASSKLLSDIAVLLSRARELGRGASLYESDRLAKRLLAEADRGRTGSTLRGPAELLGADVAKLVEEEELLGAFRELETESELSQLKKELEGEG